MGLAAWLIKELCLGPVEDEGVAADDDRLRD